MAKLIEIKGDYWKEAETGKYKVLVCTTNTVVKSNGELVMGAGIAKQFAQRFPALPRIWGNLVNLDKTRIHVSYDNMFGAFLVAMPTKNHWKDPSPIELVEQSFDKLVYHVSLAFSTSTNVLMTRPGCGNGGLSWNIVCPVLQKVLDKYESLATFTVVTPF